MMRKKSIKCLALLLAMLLALTACGGGGGNSGSSDNGGGGEPIKDLVTYEISGSREMTSFFILNTESAEDFNVLCNAYSGLLEVDTKGELMPALASEWGTEDEGKTWTFKLREGVKWVDVNGEEKADCTAQDWLTALEWVLNAKKNAARNTSMPRVLIEGAEEYYNYTNELSDAEAKALTVDNPEFKKVGIQAPDDYTLVYTCPAALPYFDTLAVCASLYPISQGLIDELGVDGMIGMSNENMWYNGPYRITEFIHNNSKTLTKNESYWDQDCTLFDTVTVRMIEDMAVGYQLYQTGEIDHIRLSESNLRTIYESGGSNEYYDQLTEMLPNTHCFQFHWNYYKFKDDGSVDTNWNTAIANENFRLSFMYGVDLTKNWARTNYIYPNHCENLAYTMKGLLYYSDGSDYVEHVIEKLNNIGPAEEGKSRRYNQALGEEYKQKAMEELTAKGVTFPVEIDYYIAAGNQTALDSATVLKECFEALGTDYVKLNIKTYVSNQVQEVRKPGIFSFMTNGWSADYADAGNFLSQETYPSKSAYYSTDFSRISNEATPADALDPDLIATFEEYTSLVNAAEAITDDMDARYEAFTVAEAYLINHGLVMPNMYEVFWQLTKVNDYSKKNAMYGCQNYMYKNWETSSVPYTTEQYAQFAAAAGK